MTLLGSFRYGVGVQMFVAILMTPLMAVAQSDTVYPWQVIASITGDFDDDAYIDRAVLVEDEGEDGAVVVDLYIYNEAVDFSLEVVGWLADPFPDGILIRQGITLAVEPNDQLSIIANSLDRHLTRRQETLTIGYTDEDYVVVAYALLLPDMTDGVNSCVIHYDDQTLFLQGEHADHVEVKPIGLNDWNREEAAMICGLIE